MVAALTQLESRVVMDGELVILNDGQLNFAALQQRLHPSPAQIRQLSLALPACLVIFDLLAQDEVDVRGCPTANAVRP
jgi:ATP-dependent DNA ligase